MRNGNYFSKKMDHKPDLVIVGTGALACMFAARLAGAGIQLFMLGTWQTGIEAIQAGGVRVLDSAGREQAFSIPVTNRVTEIAPVDFALVLVKSWQTDRVGRQLKECLSPTGTALTLQNGEGNYQALAKHLGAERVSLGATTVGAALVEPGKVQPGGEGKIFLESQAGIRPFAAWFQQAGFQVEWAVDIQAVQWGKLVISAAINPLTALLRVRNGELLANNAARQLMEWSALEAAKVAKAQHIRLPYPDPVQAVRETAEHTVNNVSSMLQDIRRGAPTEIDAISGAVVRAGERVGVPTPVNRAFWLLVKALVNAEHLSVPGEMEGE